MGLADRVQSASVENLLKAKGQHSSKEASEVGIKRANTILMASSQGTVRASFVGGNTGPLVQPPLPVMTHVGRVQIEREVRQDAGPAALNQYINDHDHRAFTNLMQEKFMKQTSSR